MKQTKSDKVTLQAACVVAAAYVNTGSCESPAKEIIALAREFYREVTIHDWETGEHADDLEDAAAIMKINWTAVLAAVFSTFFTHKMSVRLANGTLTASVGGAPVHLTANAILAGAALAYEGVPASITFTPGWPKV